MQDLGIDVLFKGTNGQRLLEGLWVSLRISLISVAISLTLGVLVGILMTKKNTLILVITRTYLEIVRFMPQMVLLFIVFFGSTRVFGWDIDAELAAVIVFSFWGVAEMADLTRGALISIPKHQYDCGGAEGRAADHRSKPDQLTECSIRCIRSRLSSVFSGVLADQSFGKAFGKTLGIEREER